MRLRTWELLGVAAISAIVGSATSLGIFQSRSASAETPAVAVPAQDWERYDGSSFNVRDPNTGKVRLSLFPQGDGRGNLQPVIMFYDETGTAEACIRLEKNGKLYQGNP